MLIRFEDCAHRIGEKWRRGLLDVVANNMSNRLVGSEANQTLDA
ncbi:MAG TPA: hypothetical protein VIX14_00825 [Terriglobales bacterium]